MERARKQIDDTGGAPRRPKIMEGPKLQHIASVSRILRAGEIGPLGEEQSWWELASNVKPWKTGLELSDNIREVLLDFVSKKIPELQKTITRLPEFSEKQLIEALAHNWFEGVQEEVGGKRQEVLLTAMAHIVKRIETTIVKKILLGASQEELNILGLEDDTMRDLLIQVLETSNKADPLYVRFMAHAQLSGKAPSLDQVKGMLGGGKDDEYYEKAQWFIFTLPDDEAPHTLGELFPREVGYMKKHIDEILASADQWKARDGGQIFFEYLNALKSLYTSTDPQSALSAHELTYELYNKLVRTSFPILITPAGDPYYRNTSLDPELKVSVVTRDAGIEEESWRSVRDVMSECLDVLGASQWSERVRQQPVRGVVTLGAFGVNLSFNAVAQESPIVVFLNEQIRAYDREFPGVLYGYIKNAEALFGQDTGLEKRAFLERLSRTMTPLHELAHSIDYYGQEGLSDRLGADQLAILDEVKAEICFRPLIPTMIEKGGLEGTRQEWAAGMLASSLIVLRDSAEKTDYWYAASYCLNKLFEDGAIALRDKKVEVIDIEKYYEVQKNAARALLDVYDDPKMTPGKARSWIKKNCMPNEHVRLMGEYLSIEGI